MPKNETKRNVLCVKSDSILLWACAFFLFLCETKDDKPHLIMRIRFLFSSLLLPLMVFCTPAAAPEQNEQTPGNTQEEQTNPDDEIDPEIKNGAKILVTNPVVQQFIEEIHYPERDYSYSAMQRGSEADFLKTTYIDLDGNVQPKLYISPGNCDIPQKYTIRWPKDTQSQSYTGKLWEGDWSTEVDLKPNPDDEVSFGFWTITNLRPNAHYFWKVTNGSTVITEGEFDTYGLLHQLIFKPANSLGVRNVRDLGGWKTKDGAKTVKYRKIYRGGRPDHIKPSGVQEAREEGIMAELDLRGNSDVLEASAFNYEGVAFCAPIIEEGYIWMLRDDKEKTRQVMQFIIDCVKADKPVYFHCSLGRDRTGTTALLCLGLLGVDEGDISKEYELTQFAPSGYSISSGEKTRMTRLTGGDYDDAALFLWDYGKHDDGSYDEFKDCVEKYLLEIGISQQDINDFRNNMLE